MGLGGCNVPGMSPRRVTKKVEDALKAAQASGSFDGAAGADGGFYSPAVDDAGNLSWTASKEGMPEIEGANIMGPAGKDGQDGATGEAGKDGVSPTISVEEIDGGYRITITDATGSKSVDLLHGEDGQDGAAGSAGNDGAAGKDGVSPTLSVSEITGGHRVTITDASGSKSFDVMDGAAGQDGAAGSDGADGEDGVGIASVVQTTTSTADGGENIITVTLTDNTTFTFKVRNGSQGSAGKDGSDGATGKDGTDGSNGADATINGVNALTLEYGDGLKGTQTGSTLKLELDADLARTTLNVYSKNEVNAAIFGAMEASY